MRYTLDQITRIFYSAGFRGEALAVMVAVSRGESGWRSDARGDTTITTKKWGPSIGLSQIRSLNADRGTGSWRDPTRLTDPYFNARAAFAISSGGTNFRPWTIFRNNDYLQWLPETRAQVAEFESRGLFEPPAGGQQMGGVGASNARVTSSTPRLDQDGNVEQVSDLDYAREHFGWVAGFLDHPELGAIISKATSERWTPDRLEAAIRETEYWKTTDDAIREFEQRRITDPASLDADLRELATEIANRASRLGLEIDGARVTEMANQALKNGWVSKSGTTWNLDSPLMAAALSSEMRYAPGEEMVGTMGVVADQIRALANDYMSIVSDSQVFNWTQEILSQKQTIEGVEQALQVRALARFPHLEAEIGAGTKPATLFEDYRQLVESELGIPAPQVDLLRDQRFSPMMSANFDGETRPMTLPEATSHIRNIGGKTGEYSRTPGAMDKVMQFRAGIERTFGKR